MLKIQNTERSKNKPKKCKFIYTFSFIYDECKINNNQYNQVDFKDKIYIFMEKFFKNHVKKINIFKDKNQEFELIKISDNKVDKIFTFN
jgi:hypothetical protein